MANDEPLFPAGRGYHYSDVNYIVAGLAMEAATDLEDFARLEELLLNRESSLEVMRGQLRTLRDQIDLATITLILTQDRIENSVRVFLTSYEGHDSGVSCPGIDVGDIRVEEDAEVTLCFEIANTGDQNLTDIQITESVLDLTNEDLIEVFGELDVLTPGQSAIRAFEFRPERNQSFRVNVTAVPNDGVNEGPSGPTVNARTSPVLRAQAAEASPGFGDGFDAAVAVLGAIWLAITVSVGFVLPLLVLLPVVYVLWRITRALGRRAQERREIAERERREEEARLQREREPAVPDEASPPPPTGQSRVMTKALDPIDEDE